MEQWSTGGKKLHSCLWFIEIATVIHQRMEMEGELGDSSQSTHHLMQWNQWPLWSESESWNRWMVERTLLRVGRKIQCCSLMRHSQGLACPMLFLSPKRRCYKKIVIFLYCLCIIGSVFNIPFYETESTYFLTVKQYQSNALAFK